MFLSEIAAICIFRVSETEMRSNMMRMTQIMNFQNNGAVIPVESNGSSNSLHSSHGSSVSVPQECHPKRFVLVAMDANSKDATVAGLTWTLQNLVRRGDAVKLLGILHYIRHPLGHKCQVDDHTWLGVDSRHLQREIASKKQKLHNIPFLDALCKQAGLVVEIDVQTGNRPEVLIVKEGLAYGATHVVLDKNLKNRRRHFYLENLSCDVTRMRRRSGIDRIRSFTSLRPDQEAPVLLSVPTERTDQTSSAMRQVPINYTPPARLGLHLESSLTASSTSSLPDNEEIDDDFITINHDASSEAGYDSGDLFSITHDSSSFRFSLSGFPDYCNEL